jgi:hypothetical protein
MADASEHGNEARGTGIAEGFWILKKNADTWISCGDARLVANICGFSR